MKELTVGWEIFLQHLIFYGALYLHVRSGFHLQCAENTESTIIMGYDLCFWRRQVTVVHFIDPVNVGLWVPIARPAVEGHLLSSAVTVSYWSTEYWLAVAGWRARRKKNWLLTFWNILERQHFKRDSEDKLLDFTPPSRLEREMPAGLVCKPESWDNHWEGRKLKPNPKEERTNLSCCHPSHTRLLISMKNKKKRNTHWANSFYMLSPRLTFPVCNI